MKHLRRLYRSARCYLICWCIHRIRTRIGFDSRGMLYYCPRCEGLPDRAGSTDVGAQDV